MSISPPPRPLLPPRPLRAPRARVQLTRPGPDRLPAWGWVEGLILAQTLLPGLLFVPGLSVLRTFLRVASYAVALIAWSRCAGLAAPRGGADTFAARPWLLFCIAWLGLSVFHPNSNSLVSAAAQATLYVAILSPAFWVPSVVLSSRQIPRMLAILFLCNALSTLMGIGQVFRPNTFNPPVIPAAESAYFAGLSYEAADRRTIMRPCGLSDTPGAACSAGLMTALLGLCWALRPVAAWKRLASLGLAFLGVAVIYYSQVRSSLVMLAICLIALTALCALRRNYRQAALLTVGGAVLILGAFAWVVGSAGDAVSQRFASLFAEDPATVYLQNRGGFVRQAFEQVLWEHPLGYGMGWWGMINHYFGRKDIASPIWVEVMWPAWIYDGGFPLLIGYVGSIAVAMFDSFRIALTCEDREFAFWAAVIVASNLGILATCFSFVTFVSPFGIQFWLHAAALHAAARRARPARKAPSPISGL